MIAPIYDYKNQTWTEIDTETDEIIVRRKDIDTRRTPDGVLYEHRKKDDKYINVIQ